MAESESESAQSITPCRHPATRPRAPVFRRTACRARLAHARRAARVRNRLRGPAPPPIRVSRPTGRAGLPPPPPPHHHTCRSVSRSHPARSASPTSGASACPAARKQAPTLILAPQHPLILILAPPCLLAPLLGLEHSGPSPCPKRAKPRPPPSRCAADSQKADSRDSSSPIIVHRCAADSQKADSRDSSSPIIVHRCAADDQKADSRDSSSPIIVHRCAADSTSSPAATATALSSARPLRLYPLRLPTPRAAAQAVRPRIPSRVRPHRAQRCPHRARAAMGSAAGPVLQGPAPLGPGCCR
jgi:hypothetical protein